jgi:hypothetical protein
VRSVAGHSGDIHTFLEQPARLGKVARLKDRVAEELQPKGEAGGVIGSALRPDCRLTVRARQRVVALQACEETQERTARCLAQPGIRVVKGGGLVDDQRFLQVGLRGAVIAPAPSVDRGAQAHVVDNVLVAGSPRRV